jgi:DNA repair protein RadC
MPVQNATGGTPHSSLLPPRCKPGDIAVFVSGSNHGKLVYVERPFQGEEVFGGTCWCKSPTPYAAWVVSSLGEPLTSRLLESKTIDTKRHMMIAVDDELLRPLRNPRRRGQSLRRADVPQPRGRTMNDKITLDASDGTPTRPAPRPRSRATVKASECIPAYGASDGVLSFRHGLKVRERTAIDKALAIVGRCLAQGRTVFDTPDAVKTYVQLQLGGEHSERFAVLFLDVQNRLLAFHTMFVGTLTQTSVYPREVVHLAIQLGAISVVLTHNHPSGTTKPSRADEMLTQTMKITLALIDVRVLDHIIVSPNDVLSMAERGLM